MKKIIALLLVLMVSLAMSGCLSYYAVDANGGEVVLNDDSKFSNPLTIFFYEDVVGNPARVDIESGEFKDAVIVMCDLDGTVHFSNCTWPDPPRLFATSKTENFSEQIEKDDNFLRLSGVPDGMHIELKTSATVVAGDETISIHLYNYGDITVEAGTELRIWYVDGGFELETVSGETEAVTGESETENEA